MKREWNLNSLYQGFNSQEFMADSAKLLRLSRELNAFEPKFDDLSDPEDTIRAYLDVLENFEALYQKLLSYASFRFSAATNDGEAAQAQTRFREIFASTARTQSVFCACLDTPVVHQLLKQNSFGEHTFYLETLLQKQAHSLTPDTESMLSSLRLTGSQAWSDLHAKSAAGEMSGDELARISAAALNAIKGESLTLCHLRGYVSPLQESLDNYHFDLRILENQMTAVKQYLPRLQNYFSLKAREMGFADGLPYNRREQLILHSDRSFEFDTAKEIILDAFEDFTPRMHRFGENFFSKSWIDSSPRAQKVVGASCDAVWKAKESRIRMQYHGTVSDANCLAHELGHGYHFENLFGQSILNCRYDLPVVEVPSKFSEILFQKRLRRELPQNEQLFCEEFALSSCINTIVDISARFLFEDRLFACRKSHELSVDEIDALMHQALLESYGNSLDLSQSSPRSWTTKPHYYNAQRNYYNFPYQFGTLLSIQMAERWKQDPHGFSAAYDRFLSSTGRYTVLDLFRILDMDLLDPSFFETPLRNLADRLDQFTQELELHSQQ